MINKGKIGAICFALWGLLHIVGGGLILMALGDGPDSGFAIYGGASVSYDALSGHILGYFAYNLVLIACLVTLVALRFNWHNSEIALAMNTGLILLIEIGLILFLIRPGHVSLLEAVPGLLLFVAGATLCGIACNSASKTKEAT